MRQTTADVSSAVSKHRQIRYPADAFVLAGFLNRSKVHSNMAIAIVPPVTPQLAPLEQVMGQSPAETWLIDFQGVTIHVAGDLVIQQQDVTTFVLAAKNISDAIRTIGAVFYREGYPATLVTYAVADSHDLYVRVVTGKIAEVNGPDALTPYFKNLTSDSPLRVSQLEGSRVLADNFSDRAGENFHPEMRPLTADSVALDLGSVSNGPKQFIVAGDFSNYGNRYAGPYLADLSIKQDTGNGDEVGVGGVTSINESDIGGDKSRPYREGDLSASHITPFGIFGVEGRYASFGQDVQTIRLDGHLGTGAVTWTEPIYADLDRRLVVQGRFERSDESVTAQTLGGTALNATTLQSLLADLGLAAAPATDAKVLSELYNTLGLDLNGVSRFNFGSHVLEVSGALGLRKGLSDSSHALSSASLSYFLIRPSLSLRYLITPNWIATGDTRFQLGNSTVPQLEQFVIGGPASLHAYDAGVGVGDHGEDAHLGIEWHANDGSFAARYSLHPRLFAEYGSTKLEQTVLDENAGHVSIADIGLSLEAKPIAAVTATLSVAQSVYSSGAESAPVGDFRKYVFFKLAGRF
jgi:hemolysin activation/secretion protein